MHNFDLSTIRMAEIWRGKINILIPFWVICEAFLPFCASAAPVHRFTLHTKSFELGEQLSLFERPNSRFQLEWEFQALEKWREGGRGASLKGIYCLILSRTNWRTFNEESNRTLGFYIALAEAFLEFGGRLVLAWGNACTKYDKDLVRFLG